MFDGQSVAELTVVAGDSAGITVEAYREIARAAKDDAAPHAEIMEIRARRSDD